MLWEGICVGIVMEENQLSVEELWVPITIRIAWELTIQGVSFGPEVLHVARMHVLSSLPAVTDVVVAERLAIFYTREFIERLNGEAYVSPSIDEDHTMEIPAAWRETLEKRANSIGKQVFCERYRDGFSLQEVASECNITVAKAKKVRFKLHQFVYRVLLRFNMDDPIDAERAQQEWPRARVEQLLTYMALLPKTKEIDCALLLSSEGAALRSCPRLHHAYILIRDGVLAPEDLDVPKHIPNVYGEESLLALQLNAKGARYAKTLNKALKEISISVRGHVWLISADDISDFESIVHDLAEEGTPARDLLRGAIGHGVGFWSDDGVFGPLPTRVISLMRSRPWGEIDGVAKLPEPIPPPKKPIKTWMAAIALFLFSVSFLQWVLSINLQEAQYPITVSSQARVNDVALRFDVHDMAVLHVISFHQGTFQVLHANLIQEKGLLATKDGRYFVRASVDQLVVVSTPNKMENWDSVLEGVSFQEDPLASLTERILHKEPRAYIVKSKKRRLSEKRSLVHMIEDWTY